MCPTTLTEGEIRTQYVVMSPDLIRLALGDRFADAFMKDRAVYEAHGGKLEVIRWVDGVIVVWAHMPEVTTQDKEHLAYLYKGAKAKLQGVL